MKCLKCGSEKSGTVCHTCGFDLSKHSFFCLSETGAVFDLPNTAVSLEGKAENTAADSIRAAEKEEARKREREEISRQQEEIRRLEGERHRLEEEQRRLNEEQRRIEEAERKRQEAAEAEAQRIRKEEKKNAAKSRIWGSLFFASIAVMSSITINYSGLGTGKYYWTYNIITSGLLICVPLFFWSPGVLFLLLPLQTVIPFIGLNRYGSSQELMEFLAVAVLETVLCIGFRNARKCRETAAAKKRTVLVKKIVFGIFFFSLVSLLAVRTTHFYGLTPLSLCFYIPTALVVALTLFHWDEGWLILFGLCQFAAVITPALIEGTILDMVMSIVFFVLEIAFSRAFDYALLGL